MRTGGKLVANFAMDGLPVREMASQANRWPPDYWDHKTGLFSDFLVKI